MFKGRAAPLLAMSALAGGMLYQTGGGTAQPRSRQKGGDGSHNIPVSETLQAIGGQGGRKANLPHEKGMEIDPKNTKIMSVSPDAHSKRNEDKVRDL
ncbi:hypothetical protein B0T17DRAFT_545562 [Bombardia bombarda]|uniref:Uncharacterized protein n=1 Tax=Bombardia bombarda TaxID=252184 RepID=A0AA39TLX3_9PEZI|nr:hypothetical protein B0T17DRAFT_545562 [Bombardia bombarda]